MFHVVYTKKNLKSGYDFYSWKKYEKNNVAIIFSNISYIWKGLECVRYVAQIRRKDGLFKKIGGLGKNIRFPHG